MWGELVSNEVLDAIKDRRSIKKFKPTPVEEDEIREILEAGRWAPSRMNKQPWKFVVIRDDETLEKINDHVPMFFSSGVLTAPVAIAVLVDPEEEPHHFIEDGAAVTQNMTLAAHSLGLGSTWIGVFDLEKKDRSREKMIKKILDVPNSWRLISILPIGEPEEVPGSERKDISSLVYKEIP